MTQFTALVLAGTRPEGDPVAAHAGVPSKALVPVAGRPMLARVLDALAASKAVADVLVVGLPVNDIAEPDLRDVLGTPSPRLVEGEASPSRSVLKALDAVAHGTPVVVTTADHALLRADIVDDFLARAVAADRDVVVGLARYEDVRAACPGARRTVLPLRDGAYCGCNLFMLRTPRGRGAVELWTRIEHLRKRPFRMAAMLGIATVVRLLARRLTLDAALARIARLSGTSVGAVVLPYGEAAVDVDKPDDLVVAERLAAAGVSR